MHTATAHTTVGSLGGVLTLGRADVCSTLCVRSSPAEVNWRRVDCNAEVVSCQFPNQPGVQFPVESVLMCQFAGVGGHPARWCCCMVPCLRLRRRQLSSHSLRAAHSTLQRTHLPFLELFKSLSHLGFKLCGNLQLATFSWVSKKI